MTIAVTGASGGVGSRVLQNLLTEADAASVVALARRPEAVPSAAQLEVRRVDYDEPGSLRAALAGVAGLVFISSDGVAEAMHRHHEHVIDAARNAAVQHVVYTSILDVAPESRFYYAGVHRATETLLARSGIAHCLARTSIFADYFVSAWLGPALEAGTLALPAASGGMSLVTRDDGARALARAAITCREGVVELTGPAALRTDEICSAPSAVTGRRVRCLPVEEPEYRRRLAGQAAPAWLDRRLQHDVRLRPRRPLRHPVGGHTAADRLSPAALRRVHCFRRSVHPRATRSPQGQRTVPVGVRPAGLRRRQARSRPHGGFRLDDREAPASTQSVHAPHSQSSRRSTGR
jgi:NAD(P)H dehydrogenase (quinone)